MINWFKLKPKTPDQELAAEARRLGYEFNKTIRQLKDRGISVTVWGRNYSGRQIIHVIEEVELGIKSYVKL